MPEHCALPVTYTRVLIAALHRYTVDLACSLSCSRKNYPVLLYNNILMYHNIVLHLTLLVMSFALSVLLSLDNINTVTILLNWHFNSTA